ncbi:MAG: hypothetical protein DRH07_00355 [Deltaproteobacteria bacterium]|nr:MAG: hypothetical protein DRH07_00355 [Deltaproteobacteria bacterium]
MKLLAFFLVPLLLTGCAVFEPQPQPVVLPDRQEFCQAFDEFQESHQIDAFQKLVADFPESIWASRAETIILYSQEIEQRKEQNDQLLKSEQQHSLDLEHLIELNKQLTVKTEQLGKLNQELTDKIEQLKTLLIQSEKHPQ